MQGRPRGTLCIALQPMPASRIFADGWEGMIVSVFETLSHHKVGQFQPICPAFLNLHYFVPSLLEERTSRQAHFRSDCRDSVFPGSLFYGREQQTPDADLLIILVHKQRVQIAFTFIDEKPMISSRSFSAAT